MPSMSDIGDDPEKFFHRPLCEVSNADLWRWNACRQAYRELHSKEG